MNPKRSLPGPLVATVLLGAAAIGLAFYFKPFPALEDRALLLSDGGLRVETTKAGLGFVPAAAKDSGLVVYGAARVPPEAYAYLARACAAAGYTSVIAAVPLNFAALAPSRASLAAKGYPGVKRWVVAGHSMGGAAAAAYAAREARKPGAAPVGGLLLLASFPERDGDLSTKSLHVVTVGASRDALVSPAKIAEAWRRLPATNRFIEIAGGNHSQFGEYGPQSGDGIAEISGPAQRKAVVEEALGLLDLVEAEAGK